MKKRFLSDIFKIVFWMIQGTIFSLFYGYLFSLLSILVIKQYTYTCFKYVFSGYTILFFSIFLYSLKRYIKNKTGGSYMMGCVNVATVLALILSCLSIFIGIKTSV